ncbi:MAG: sensor histidine kinase [Methanosarcina sp.]
MLKKLNRVFTSPYFLAFIPFLIICFLVNPGFKKYSLKIEDTTILPENEIIWYNDLDNDGISEKIMTHQQDFATAVMIFRNDIVIDQWNFEGTFEFWNKRCLFIAGDADNDMSKEVYIFTLSHDTILLHCISSPYKTELSIKNRPIAKTGPGLIKPDPFIIPAEMDDLDGDGIKELIFGIGAGFSIYPRKVFAYYISKDSLVESPESSYFISSILQADINNDGKREIIPYGISSGNVKPDEATYHDYSNFTMVLDQNLKFLFKPIEFKGRYTTLSPKIIPIQNKGISSVVWLHSGEDSHTVLYFTNESGGITDSILLNYQVYDTGAQPAISDKGWLHMYMPDGLALISKDFKLLKKVPGIKVRTFLFQDVDQDGKNEALVIENNRIHVYREGFNDEINVQTQPLTPGIDIINIKKSGSGNAEFSVQAGTYRYLLYYGKNPAHPYLFLYYAAVYLSILAFALTIKNIQKNQTKKKYETEKKISELQLALIRNQLDPHFTFNVINSIIYSVEFRENEQAATQLRQFAGLYRNLVLSASSTRRTIEEELEFCENYLNLEKMRFMDRFDYSISIADNIDRTWLVPKFIIQIYAENAVKHGLSELEKGGFLEISLKNDNETLLIEITDNGIGRAKSAVKDKTSTGKGLETMEELFSVYNKYYDEKISSTISDLYDVQGNSQGTRISIRLRRQNDKS